MYEALRDDRTPTNLRNNFSATTPRRAIASPNGSCHSMRRGLREEVVSYAVSCRIADTPLRSNGLGSKTSTTLS